MRKRFATGILMRPHRVRCSTDIVNIATMWGICRTLSSIGRTCKSSGYPEGLGVRFDYKLALTQSYRYRKSLVTNMFACKNCCVHASQSKPTMNRILILIKWYEQYSFVLFKDYSSFYKFALITKLEISYIKKLLLYI